LAIVVPDTEGALTIWRDGMGFPVLYNCGDAKRHPLSAVGRISRA
jgi:hypothetical protein